MNHCKIVQSKLLESYPVHAWELGNIIQIIQMVKWGLTTNTIIDYLVFILLRLGLLLIYNNNESTRRKNENTPSYIHTHISRSQINRSKISIHIGLA